MTENTSLCFSNRRHYLSFTTNVKLFATTMELSHGCSAAVAEVPVFPSDSLLPLPSLQSSPVLPPPPSTCSRSSGWVWAGLLQTRALCHPAPPSYHLSHYQPLSFVQPILLCVVWFTQAWETCDHSAGYQELQAASVFGRGGGGGREGTRKTIWLNRPTIRTFCATWEHVDSAKRHWLHLTGIGLK